MSDEIFKEVDDALRLERLRQNARRFAGAGLGAIIVLCLGIAGWEYHQNSLSKAAERQSATYIKALHDLGSDTSVAGLSVPLTKEQEKALSALQGVAQNGPSGLAALARLRTASSEAAHGKLADALTLWDKVQQDHQVPAELRNLASLLWCQWQIDTGDIAAIRSRLSVLTSESKPFAALANEQLATLDIRAGDMKSAKQRLTTLSQDYNAPNGVRMRAGALLQTLDQPS